MSYFRSDLTNLPAYVAGKPGSDPSIIKLSSNEMPFGTLPAVRSVLDRDLDTLNAYPDMGAVAMRKAIADFHGVDIAQVAVSNGSVNMIEKIVDAVCDPGTEVVMAWRSFEAYPIAVTLAGAVSIQVPVTDDGEHDLAAMAEAVTDKTRAILLCSPNNPTGTAFTHTELEDFLGRVDSSIPVILDEAYIDFARLEDPVRSEELLQSHPNLIILRTFSKVYSLAGLRIGYTLAQAEVAEVLRAIATPFGVNTLAQAAAIAALGDTDEVRKRSDFIVSERERVLEALDGLGYKIPRSQGNFVWFAMTDVELFVEVANRHLITVRPFAGDGVRVTIGNEEANDRIIAAAKEYSQRG